MLVSILLSSSAGVLGGEEKSGGSCELREKLCPLPGLGKKTMLGLLGNGLAE
jgi:hypothetical protein